MGAPLLTIYTFYDVFFMEGIAFWEVAFIAPMLKNFSVAVIFKMRLIR